MDEFSAEPRTVPPPAPPPTLPVDVRVEFPGRVNFAMQQNGVRLVGGIELTCRDEGAIDDLSVSVILANGEADPWTGHVARVPPGGTYRLEPDGPVLDARRLAGRTEAERTRLDVEVVSPAGTARRSMDVDLLPVDHWPGVSLYPELTAAFVTPNHSRVAELLRGAREALGKVDASDALDGYQSKSRTRAVSIAEACFNAVQARGWGYVNPPASFERQGQRVRLADRLCREGLGTCLDLTLLLASMWEQCGLHALVLLPEGHALPALWTHEARLPEPATDEPARIRNLIELGEIVPVESTLLTHKGADFHAAVAAGKKALLEAGSGFCAIDVATCRRRGIRPLPLRDDDAVEPPASGGQAAAPSGRALDRVALAERADASQAVGDAQREPEDARVRRWRTRLLDLSLRNRLLNYVATKRTAELIVGDLPPLTDHLAEGRRISVVARGDLDEAQLADELAAGRVYADHPQADLDKRLVEMFRTARSGLEETGANLLYLTLGRLRWFESESASTIRLAPLVLVPVRLDRRASGAGYRYDVSAAEEAPRVNVTLLEKLRSEFGIDTGPLHELREDESGHVDLPLVLRDFRDAIRDMGRWEVEEKASLGLFSFSKFLMWRDLGENLDNLRRNKLVARLVGGGGGGDVGDGFTSQPLDTSPLAGPEGLDELPPGVPLCTRDADSSQLAALQAAAAGRSFVLEGPPGTGKSQTIANLIADRLAAGQRVLFVAEKQAALSVVSRRLEEDGIAPFCLELHSAKASKLAVLEQVRGNVTDEPPAPYPHDWDGVRRRLGESRRHLNVYVRALHEQRPSGETLYEVSGRLALLGEGPESAPAADDSARTTADELAGWRRGVSALVDRGRAIDPPQLHPLRGVGRTRWEFDLPRKAADAAGEAREAVDALSQAVDAFASSAGTHDYVSQASKTGVRAAAVAAQAVRETPAACPSRDLLVGEAASRLIVAAREAVSQGRSADAERERLHARYREEFLDLDPLENLDVIAHTRASFWPLALWRRMRARRRLRRYVREGGADLEAMSGDFEASRDLRHVRRQLDEHPLASTLGGHWKGANTDWAALETMLDGWDVLRKTLTVVPRPLAAGLADAACDADRLAVLRRQATGVIHAWNGWASAWGKVKSLLEPVPGDDGLGWAMGTRDTLARWRDAAGDLDRWCPWRRARDDAVAGGLGDLVAGYEAGEFDLTQLADAFERGYGRAWFNATANATGPVRDFSAEGQSQTVERFRRADRDLMAAAPGFVAAELERKAAVALQSHTAQVKLLRRELEKKRRHLATRRLIGEIPDLLSVLKPCFLMSPLSVAQYLDAGLPPFELVVFDEASQIPVWDAIGTIARGREVVVVGDSKQLPPTNFFNVLDGDVDDDEEVLPEDDMESILKECNAAGVSALRLRWHYRSRHESLIAFSNHHYYDNDLLTFPSPEPRSPDLGVTFRHVAGVYDRGGSRTNKIEAEAVVSHVVSLLKVGQSSVGVVTFNQAQQTLIEDLLDKARREHPEIEPFFAGDDGVFVKNLENVQGDERDTIVFSVGYGPDAAGRPSMNFGPLNKDGGERRLNVAVTRARRRLIVFSSLRADQIDLRRTQATGVRHFKTFLDYADRGPDAIVAAVEQTRDVRFDSGFERAVWKALTDRGWDVDTQVGCSGYRIDLGVIDPDRPGSYLLGIECDGAAYHSGFTARDRDRLRQSVLENLGWRIERVWSTEWRIDPARCLARLEAALDDAKALRAATAAPPAEPHVEPDDEPRETPVAAPPPAPAGPIDVSTYVPVLPDPSDAAAAVEAIVAGEGPVVEELVVRRLAGRQRLTPTFRKALARVLSGAVRDARLTRIDDVLWPAGDDPASWRGLRLPGDDPASRRDLLHVPVHERINALIHLLSRGTPGDEATLKPEAARLIGVQRVTQRHLASIAQAIAVAVFEGRLARVDDANVALPPDQSSTAGAAKSSSDLTPDTSRA